VGDKQHTDGRRLFVGNLSYEATDRELADLFADFVAVEEAVVVKDRESGKARGFGFVTLVRAGDVDLATERCRDLYLRGRRIRVDKAAARSGEGGQRGRITRSMVER
jgi:RNA recognition motif-containing protein